MNRIRYSLVFAVLDAVLSGAAWLLFWVIRKTDIESPSPWHPMDWSPELFLKTASVGLGWVGLFWVAGLYRSVHRRSRLRDAGLILQYSLIGVGIISFATFLNDPLNDLTDLRLMVLDYYLLQASLLITFRVIGATLFKRWMIHGGLGFNTLIVGCGVVANKLYDEMQDPRRAPGFRIKGYIRMPDCEPNAFLGKLKRLGDLPELAEACRSRRIEEIIIALDHKEQDQFLAILRAVRGLNVKINVVPDMYDVLVGNVKLSNVYGAPLVEVSPHLMPPWQRVAKRALDVLASGVALLLVAPAMLVIAIAVKCNSKGPVFYRQERIGKGGIPFYIIKFRSMRTDAEQGTPRLSSSRDPRITSVGSFLRRSHLDELPQFWNVLRGDMSLVGPRPERQFFIDQIMERAPEYAHLQKVRPGITSLGQVKYGYAENVDQMIERLQFDLIYIENMSLSLDFKIMAYTLLRMIEGDGK